MQATEGENGTISDARPQALTVEMQFQCEFSACAGSRLCSTAHDEITRRRRRRRRRRRPVSSSSWAVEATRIVLFGRNKRGSNVWSGQIPFRIADLPPATRPTLRLTADRAQKFASLSLRSPHFAGETRDLVRKRIPIYSTGVQYWRDHD